MQHSGKQLSVQCEISECICNRTTLSAKHENLVSNYDSSINTEQILYVPENSTCPTKAADGRWILHKEEAGRAMGAR